LQGIALPMESEIRGLFDTSIQPEDGESILDYLFLGGYTVKRYNEQTGKRTEEWAVYANSQIEINFVLGYVKILNKEVTNHLGNQKRLAEEEQNATKRIRRTDEPASAAVVEIEGENQQNSRNAKKISNREVRESSKNFWGYFEQVPSGSRGPSQKDNSEESGSDLNIVYENLSSPLVPSERRDQRDSKSKSKTKSKSAVKSLTKDEKDALHLCMT